MLHLGNFQWKSDAVCLSETVLNSKFLSDNDHLQVPGYSIAWVDHPSKTKRGGVCAYYKNSFSLNLLDIKYLQECINLEPTIVDNVCNFIILYRSPSQTHDDFEINNKKINKKILLTVPLVDFNAKSQTWCKSDKTSKLDILKCSHGLYELINEPTHLLDSFSSCIDLAFTSQANLWYSLSLIYQSLISTLRKNSVVLQQSEC